MKCVFIKSDNKKCNANSIKSRKFCFRHDPALSEERLLASTKGGNNRALQGLYGDEINLNSPQDIKNFIGIVINGVWTGKVPVPVGTSMGFLAKCWLEAHNSTEIQIRIEVIENKLLKIKK